MAFMMILKLQRGAWKIYHIFFNVPWLPIQCFFFIYKAKILWPNSHITSSDIQKVISTTSRVGGTYIQI